jgi:hypothetical protein
VQIVAGLYEVVEVKPRRGLVLRDLVRGGEPVEVDDQLGSQSAAIWDRIAARVLSIGGRHYLSGAILNFEREPAEAVLRVFRISPERAKHRRDRACLAQSDEPPCSSLLFEENSLFRQNNSLLTFQNSLFR